MLRFWLEATQLGLSVHAYAAPGVLTLVKPNIDPVLNNELNDVKKALAEQLRTAAKAIMFFRIVYKKCLSKRSRRRNLDPRLKKVSGKFTTLHIQNFTKTKK
jgi:hypothetical protein